MFTSDLITTESNIGSWSFNHFLYYSIHLPWKHPLPWSLVAIGNSLHSLSHRVFATFEILQIPFVTVFFCVSSCFPGQAGKAHPAAWELSDLHIPALGTWDTRWVESLTQRHAYSILLLSKNDHTLMCKRSKGLISLNVTSIENFQGSLKSTV